VNPVVVQHAVERAEHIPLRLADTITALAGSMPFVFFHVVAFASWMRLPESDRWPKPTLMAPGGNS
jgi:uncharacterized membrane protein